MVRFTLLSPTLVRLEFSPSGSFVDQPSVVVTNRSWPRLEAKEYARDGFLCLEGERLRIRYREDSGPFAPHNLEITYRHGSQWRSWRPGQSDPHNLGGTLHSLDGVSESSLPPLPDGILSRSGFYVLQDERHALLTPEGWHAPRKEPDAQDWYFFGYGTDYGLALQEYARLTGAIPLLPRWTFGAWYSRYWPYKEQELREVVLRFQREGFPLDVLVIDVDWHLHGWEGYDWNPAYFPKPEEFLAWLHRQGLKVTLNNHPGLLPREESRYAEVCARLGTGSLAPDGSFVFNLALKDHAEVFMDLLHKPFHAQGVDFWWIDGAAAAAPGVNGQMWTNKVYFEKSQSYTGKRGLIFSRYGGPGSHRYPICFSGDTYSDWGVLRYEIAFTATAGNVLIPYWTHDIGGFFGNKLDDELYVRWVQFGALSPCLRLHSDHGIREPWHYNAKAQRIVRHFFQLRYRLLPYLYTYAHEAHQRALPLCRPLYLEWPHIEEAYTYPHEYLLGRELLVAPIDEPGRRRVATKEVYFPPGAWVDLFTGRRIQGPKVAVWRSSLAEMPLFARAGAIIPQANEARSGTPETLSIDVYTGSAGSFALYEDDGETLAFQSGQYRITPIIYEIISGHHRVTLGPATGSYPSAPKARAYVVRLVGLPKPAGVALNGRNLPQARSKRVLDTSEQAWHFDKKARWVLVKTGLRSPSEPIVISVNCTADAEYLQLLATAEHCLHQVERVAKLVPTESVWAPMRREVWTLKKRVHAYWKGAVSGTAGKELLRNELEGTTATLRGLAERVARLPDTGRHRALLEQLFELVACPRLGEVLGGQATLPISCTFASGAVAPPILVRSRLEVSPEWQHCVQGSEIVEGKLLPGEVFTVRFLVTPPTRFSVDRVFFKLNNSLRWNNQEFDYPAEFVFPATFLQAYHLIGPFDNLDGQALDRMEPPEYEIDLGARYQGRFGQVRWQKWQWRPPRRSTGAVFINLRNTIWSGHDVAAYAVTELESPKEMQVLFALGSTGGYRLWVNGEMVHVHRQQRPAQIGQDRLLVHLRAGRNRVLIKSAHTGGSWGFFLQVTDTRGRPVPGLINTYVE
ncbi:MAG: DUF5110 domain-containing protein [candidate division KSB1 bacterium]|nr:DUF5110 domain-containing protein [candidate division KSB1 bacterium]